MLILALVITMQTFTTVAQGTSSGIDEARQVVVRTPAEWTALWKAHAGDTKPPAVDFGTAMVVAVFAGSRPTAGHTIEITKIEAQDGGLVVRYRERGPRPDEMVAQMLTEPFHVVRTGTHRGKITFARER